MPKIFVDGKRVALRAECAGCHVIAESSPPPKGWEYVEPRWLCPKCQNQGEDLC